VSRTYFLTYILTYVPVAFGDVIIMMVGCSLVLSGLEAARTSIL
jgi:hypothetical protein